jgi:hypothetical protein
MKIQVAQLVGKIHQPDAFVRGLHNLLDFYADRTYRPGQSGEPPPLLATYKTPTPVFRQIVRETSSLAVADPPSALALVDTLWAEPYIEFRLLAITLIGKIPPIPAAPVLTRLQDWVATRPENRLLDAILEHGFILIRRDCPQIYSHLIDGWLKTEDLFTRQAGLRAIVSILGDPKFENLPLILPLLIPLIRIPPSVLNLDLVAALRALVRRFPQEAGYILRQNLSTESPDTVWLARQVLGDFPRELQENLREALRPFNPQ